VNEVDRLNKFKQICKQFPPETYQSIDNNRLALYAIKTLQNNRIPVTQEAVAVALFLFFPKKFSLIGFTEFPDVERVHRTLLQLGPKWRNWAKGDTHHGFSLNQDGEAEFKRAEEALRNPSESSIMPRRRKVKSRTRDPNKEIKEIEGTSFFREYLTGKREGFGEFAIWELLKSYPYAPKEALRDRLETLIECAKLANRSDILEFLFWVKKEFANLLSS
jgi:hypothetical protein